MQERHINRKLYFEELSITSEKYIIPYIETYKKVENGLSVLEIGCGDGGNCLPFALKGCEVTGIDVNTQRISEARQSFADKGLNSRFEIDDIRDLQQSYGKFDIILCHDVIEHVDKKELLLMNISKLLNNNGIVFLAFPAWYMPFGGHQQICTNKLLSHFPWLHLLPKSMYGWVLKQKENKDCVEELLDIKRTQITIERFEKMIARDKLLDIVNRKLYLINPHYETKFGLRPRVLPKCFAKIPFFRNFLATTCFYILKNKD